jgi:hypothetical protein
MFEQDYWRAMAARAKRRGQRTVVKRAGAPLPGFEEGTGIETLQGEATTAGVR